MAMLFTGPDYCAPIINREDELRAIEEVFYRLTAPNSKPRSNIDETFFRFILSKQKSFHSHVRNRESRKKKSTTRGTKTKANGNRGSGGGGGDSSGGDDGGGDDGDGDSDFSMSKGTNLIILLIPTCISSEETQKESITQYEKEIHRLNEQNRFLVEQLVKLSTTALERPSKQISDSDYVEVHGNVSIDKVTVIRALEDIKQVVEHESEKSFKSKTKKKILHILDDAVNDIAKDGLKEAGRKIVDLAQKELVPLLPKLATQLGILKLLSEV